MNIDDLIFVPFVISFFSAALCLFAASAFPVFVTVYWLFAVGWIAVANSLASVNGYRIFIRAGLIF